MFIFGHVGLTICLLLIALLILKKNDDIYKLDFRLIAIFAILPDIIDKSIGHLIFYDTLNNGRLFCHTLIFLVIFCFIFYLIIGTYWWIYSFPIITHQLFDRMWEAPNTWLWPGYGFEFKSFDINVWEHWYSALISNPYIISTEILGVIVLLFLFIYFKLYVRNHFICFIKTGRVNPRARTTP